jgi:hypothetical protein
MMRLSVEDDLRGTLGRGTTLLVVDDTSGVDRLNRL